MKPPLVPLPSPAQEALPAQGRRLDERQPPLSLKAARSVARSQAYQSAADASSTLRAYKADLANFKAWCVERHLDPMPSTPEIVGAYLADAGRGYALSTLRRRVAAIARAHRIARHPLDTRHPAIRETLRGIGRLHGEPPRRSAALATADVKQLLDACRGDMAGIRDRALLLVCFAGALRRSELVGLDVERLTWTTTGLTLLITRSKTDKEGAGAEIGIPYGGMPETCPVDWEPITPHGLRAGFVTTAYKNGVPDEEIMGHTRHRSLTTMRGYVRRAKLNTASPAGKLGL